MFAKKLDSNKLPKKKKMLIVIDKIVLKSWVKNVKLSILNSDC